MKITLIASTLVLIAAIGHLEAAHAEYTLSEYPKVVIRAPRSIGNFFKRMFTKNKTGFQGTSMANTGYAASASSYYPAYGPGAASYPGYAGTSPYGGSSGYGAYPGMSAAQSGPNPYGSFGVASYASPSYAQQANFGGYGGYSGANQMAAASAYPSYQGAPNGGGSPDFHAVLDQFVRSAGLNPNGGAHDQDVAASSITSKDGGFNLNIPYMKRHIKRMSSSPSLVSGYERRKLQRQRQEEAQRQQYYGQQEPQQPLQAPEGQSQQLTEQQQQILMALSSSDYLQNYIQQYLREKTDREQAESSEVTSSYPQSYTKSSYERPASYASVRGDKPSVACTGEDCKK
ncbi:hypothetical protein HDE_04034 [Halotydeus destructor]|nr:hypothetical protein HDE_04034 [Halotydeus destructor]